tara:strand:- start:271 stop:1380 length:1110 start_codon:yes stop_codon:yes gene_type:complete
MGTYKNIISIVLPSYNEYNNITLIIKKLLKFANLYDIEILVVDDDSNDGTTSLVRDLARDEARIRLIHRIGRAGLSSAIKEGVINAKGDIVAIMDSDGQHEPEDVLEAIRKLISNQLDIVIGSRFQKNSDLQGLSKARQDGSTLANNIARISLSRKYSDLSDYMSGCIVIRRDSCLAFTQRVDVNGFKFLYELLAISNGCLNIQEIPIKFKSRSHGKSKLDISILWDFIISLLHTISGKILPRRAISFALVGLTGVFVQLISTEILIRMLGIDFEAALPYSVVLSASSNYLINNFLTFRSRRLKNMKLITGLLKFLVVASLPVIANVGLATSFYNFITPSTLLAQIAGIIVVFIWNYAASSRFVWNSPS